MLDRTAEKFDVRPSRLVGDVGYGSAEMIGWLVDERGIETHVKLMDKSERTDGTFSQRLHLRSRRQRLCLPRRQRVKKYHRNFARPRNNGLTKDGTLLYFARKQDCDACALKPKCCPNMPARLVARSIYEAARDKARAIAKADAYLISRRERKKVEMLFAHLKRIFRLGKLRLRVPSGAKDEFLLAATAQNLRKLAKLTALPARSSPHEPERPIRAASIAIATVIPLVGLKGFFNAIRPIEASKAAVRYVRSTSTPDRPRGDCGSWTSEPGT